MFSMDYKTQKSSDGVIKINFSDGYSAVIIPTKDEKFAVCVSCQVGCPVGCKFCYTGKLGFGRNLSSEEIVEQVSVAKNIVGSNPTSIIFMGMGEPTLNLKNVLLAGEKIHEEFKISYNRITISSSGLKTLKNLVKVPFNLALSVHSPFDEVRKKLIPGAISVNELVKFANESLKNANNKKYIMIEYSMIAGVNDREEDLKELISLKWPERSLFNLIEFNPIDDLKASSTERMEHFKEKIISAGWKCFIRSSRGKDIGAACGMLDAD